ncbi:MAG: M24 family metallopeptidase, partial [Anaerolineae bacterium]|nr:M24 family metallopeptidase [Anaerolineae bacterium]
MKADLDHLMAARDLDAIVVSGKVLGNTSLIYMLNGVHLTSAQVIQKRGSSPHLIVSPIEREEALAAGYPLTLTTQYNLNELIAEYQGDLLAATAEYQQRIFEDLDVRGRIGFYGARDQGESYVFLHALNAAMLYGEVVGEFGKTLLLEARATKDAAEVARIREVGRRTAEVVRQTLAFLQQHAVGADEVLRRPDGATLTVGDVHAQIQRLIAAQGLEAPEGFIFSTGRDAAVPHNKGTRDAPIRLGESIIFDIYPREVNGYFFDMTRTFCLGYAPEPVLRLHQDVQDVMAHIRAAYRVGELARSYQQMACDFFHTRGHPTLGDDPTTLEGYVHGLGHGVG